MCCGASLRVPARLVEQVYGQLADGGCIPRRWHREGRYGIPIQIAEDSQRRLIPLLADAPGRSGLVSLHVYVNLENQRAWVCWSFTCLLANYFSDTLSITRMNDNQNGNDRDSANDNDFDRGNGVMVMVMTQ